VLDEGMADFDRGHVGGTHVGARSV